MAHAALSIALWDNMMQREGDKDTRLDPATVRIVCPARDARVRLGGTVLLLLSRAAHARACCRSLLRRPLIHQLSAAVSLFLPSAFELLCFKSSSRVHMLLARLRLPVQQRFDLFTTLFR